MSQETTDLKAKIQGLKNEKKETSQSTGGQGYSVALSMMTDLISCIFVGLGLGLFFQKIFHASVLLTAGFTLLGGIAGLYTTIRFAIRQDKK